MRNPRRKQIPDATGVLRCTALVRCYKSMVFSRTGKQSYVKIDHGDVVMIASKLKSIKLAKLWVEAQFDAMPQNWCRLRFKRKYPPVNVVFADKESNWGRYEEYIRS